ncbi:carboxymuconolactone decarboxylase family protein [Pseudothioclava nitratireducens]|jgi:AhpD family alkylhydroperoxidase|uniref:carboxymuconolactone decarboxylase family protein n=1 Tax=Pseudothioclava nitratireducens TaxID=1928646 RepID=UPI0023DC50A9|nr:carboxymuconolactone decarboxylase family protein [Defluviimonas nitratireducens]MDF1620618.1 carboxymuconolactone decarboxylase family protein [Defluviimonas nitratireducens]
MATITPPKDPESDPRVKAVFDDIRATRGTDFINNVWRYLAFDPGLLEQTWAEVKAVMAAPTALEPKVKEMIYAAVSIANSCEYCTHSHLAAARAKGMTPAEQADFFRVVASAGKTNHLLNGLRIPVDDAFLMDKE